MCSILVPLALLFFFFNDTATTEIYTLSLHDALPILMGTAAVAIGTAAAIPGTLVNLAAGGSQREAVRFGHPSGTLRVGAQAAIENGKWAGKKAIMNRSERVLMEGWVRVPSDNF